jgi:hypothetical protein
MSKGMMQQLFVFAAIFLVLQVVLDLMQGVAITPAIFASRLIVTVIATAVYGVLLIWLKKRKERRD